MAQHMIKDIDIHVDGKIIGHMQTIKIDTDLTSKRIKIEASATYVGIEKDALDDMFKNGLVSPSGQIKPMNVNMLGIASDDGTERDLMLQDCWIKNVGSAFMSGNIMVFKDISFTVSGSSSGDNDVMVQAAMFSTKGVTCKKCGDYNEYLDVPSESDGTHLCYKCRSGF